MVSGGGMQPITTTSHSFSLSFYDLVNTAQDKRPQDTVMFTALVCIPARSLTARKYSTLLISYTCTKEEYTPRTSESQDIADIVVLDRPCQS